ncbi:unnamed protein product [Cercospora beticola]|nr:unnamed protein product [Cercospora beticola]
MHLWQQSSSYCQRSRRGSFGLFQTSTRSSARDEKGNGSRLRLMGSDENSAELKTAFHHCVRLGELLRSRSKSGATPGGPSIPSREHSRKDTPEQDLSLHSLLMVR